MVPLFVPEESWGPRSWGINNRLDELEPPRRVEPVDGSVRIEFDLPMPAVSLVELTPV
jgi:hypothetical protein